MMADSKFKDATVNFRFLGVTALKLYCLIKFTTLLVVINIDNSIPRLGYLATVVHHLCSISEWELGHQWQHNLSPHHHQSLPSYLMVSH